MSNDMSVFISVCVRWVSCDISVFIGGVAQEIHSCGTYSNVIGCGCAFLRSGG